MKNKQINLNYSFSLYSLIRRFIGIAIIVVLVYFLFNSNKEYEELLKLNEVATEELKISRNKNGELVAKIGSFETSDSKDFEKYKTTDSLIITLQKEVQENRKLLKKKGSVTQFTTTGSAQTTTDTQVSTSEDGSTVYKSSFNLDGWVFGKSIATKDTTYYDIGYKDKYSLVIGVEPTGLLGLGKGKPFGEVTSSNPYNTIKTLKTYQVALPKPKRFGIGPNISISPSFKDGNIVIQPTVGFGVQYNLIRF